MLKNGYKLRIIFPKSGAVVCALYISSPNSMDRMMENLVITEEEEEDLVVDDTMVSNANLCLIGRFVSGHSVNFNLMRSRITSTWKLKKGINIKDIGNMRFLIQFSYAIDLMRVLDGCPWSFGRFPLIVHQLSMGEIPHIVPLNKLMFWVQVFNLPISCFSEAVGEHLGNFIGRMSNDVSTCAEFKYERLNLFCFICGKLDHTESMCDVLYDSASEEVVKAWGPWLRALDRWGIPMQGDQWLKARGYDEQAAEGSPMGGCHASQNLDVGGGLAGEDELVTVVNGGHSASIHDLDITLSSKNINYNPVYKEPENDTEEDLGANLLDLRKQKRQNVKQGTINDLALTLSGSATAVVGVNSVNVISTIDVTKNQHFLEAGPASGACHD
ncbi:hypothetical protein ACS0TY_016689 [Phlomoides rotata]